MKSLQTVKFLHPVQEGLEGWELFFSSNIFQPVQNTQHMGFYSDLMGY